MWQYTLSTGAGYIAVLMAAIRLDVIINNMLLYLNVPQLSGPSISSETNNVIKTLPHIFSLSLQNTKLVLGKKSYKTFLYCTFYIQIFEYNQSISRIREIGKISMIIHSSIISI